MTLSFPGILPRPSELQIGQGEFALAADTSISYDDGAEDCALLLREYLRVTGFPLRPSDSAGQSNVIELRLIESRPSRGSAGIGQPYHDESYQLAVDPNGARITAANVVGLRHGIQTLRQLLPPEIYAADVADRHWRIPCVRITDAPRFTWRGSLIDVGRWYLPLEYLYRYVETLALHKMNRLHLHLTDDQGWRFQVKQYPQLTGVAGWRAESQLGHPSECPSSEWEASPAAHRRMTELGIDSAVKAQPWFTNRICSHLRRHSRIPIVWDEAATSSLPQDAIVMAWQHEQAGIDAAQRGHQVIMTPMQHTYFDWYQSDQPDEPVAIGGLTTLRDVYDYEPIPEAMPSDARSQIIGTQGQLWGEYLPTPLRVDDMAFPRLCALAERSWSAPDADYADFQRRLSNHARRLEAAGVALRWTDIAGSA